MNTHPSTLTPHPCPSPNHDSRNGAPVDMLVLHYTGMKTGEGALAKLCDGACERRVSAHYLVEEDGRVFALVPEAERAWHAGVSSWHGHADINARSIGIEIVNPGHEYGYRPFPEIQMQAVAKLCRDILARHPIPPANVVAHSDIAPARKQDPGELFDWQWLAGQGVGVWPSASGERRAASGELAEYGYDVSDLPKAILAFQRHFRPARLTGEWDEECEKLLAELLA